MGVSSPLPLALTVQAGMSSEGWGLGSPRGLDKSLLGTVVEVLTHDLTWTSLTRWPDPVRPKLPALTWRAVCSSVRRGAVWCGVVQCVWAWLGGSDEDVPCSASRPRLQPRSPVWRHLRHDGRTLRSATTVEGGEWSRDYFCFLKMMFLHFTPSLVTVLIPRSHSYCLSLPLCHDWYI